VVIFLGLVVAVVAVVVGVDVAVENTASTTLTVFGRTVPGVTSQGQAFLFGVGLTVVFLVGLIVAFLAASRAIRLRRELRLMREEAEESITTLERQKRQLQRELAQARRDNGGIAVTWEAADPPEPNGSPSFFDSGK
jgi:uncharacterized membrane protein YgaE (UPF0421/DUF939 family)